MENFTLKLQSDDKKPLYEQLYRHIIGEIEAGRLKNGEKLPSKRALCAHLGISQSTVETAYSLLAAEGYILSRPRSGYIVADETTGATECPFCGNPVIMTGQFSGSLKPDYVIPFKLDKNAAKQAAEQ